MDPIYWSTVLVIISRLFLGSSAQTAPGFGDYCNQTTVCHVGWYLQCVTNACACEPNKVQVGTSKQCGDPVVYGGACNATTASCVTGLVCDSRTGRCNCDPREIYDPTNSQCRPRVSHGESCQMSPDDCMTPAELTCQSGKCACDIPNRFIWILSLARCIQQSVYDQTCNSTTKPCVTGLLCDSGTGKCSCDPIEIYNPTTSKCRPRVSHGGTCQKNPDDCMPRLVCDSITGTCSCDAREIYNSTTSKCGPRVSHGGSCQMNPDDCNTVVGLTCESGKCACDIPNRFTWIVSLAGCIQQSIYNENCHAVTKPCVTGLLCDSGTGRCSCNAREIYNSATSKCQPRVSHGDTCQMNPDDCMTPAGLTCQSGKCACNNKDGFTWIVTQSECMKQAVVGERCNIVTKPCRAGYNLECAGPSTANVCVCNPANLVPQPGGSCGEKAKHDEVCDPPGCDTALNIVCRKKRCTCTKAGTYFPWPDKSCGPYPKHGEKCDVMPTCDPSGFMKCDGQKCVCQEYVPGSTTNCVSKAKYGGNCTSSSQCNEGIRLKCSTTNRCICADSTEVELKDTGGCGRPGLFDEDCTHRACNQNGKLRCGSNKRCECIPGQVEHKNKVCGEPAKYDEVCNLPSCLPGFECNGTPGKCFCNPKDVAHAVAHSPTTCGPFHKYNQPCNWDICFRGPDWNLKCSNKRCECEGKNVEWREKNRPSERCGPPALFGQNCELRECKQGGEMNCRNMTNNAGGSELLCTCKPNKVEVPGKVCGDRAKYDEACGPPACLDANLTCQSKRCVCSGRWMEHDLTSGGCKNKPKSILYEYCELSVDCQPGFRLQCFNSACVCQRYCAPDEVITNKTDGSPDRCYRVPSDFGKYCENDIDCRFSPPVFCNTTLESCLCQYSFDLDPTNTTCEYNKWNGQPFGEPCESFIPVRSEAQQKQQQRQQCYSKEKGLICGPPLNLNPDCISAHNLNCTEGGVCVCTPKHVPIAGTLPPPLSLITCVSEGGGLGYGARCTPGAHSLDLQCDTYQSLACEKSQKFCTCAIGSVPTGNKKQPCEVGNEKFDSPCDPPEVITPHPITGLPTSSNPKLACDATVKLVCVEGQCGCRDEETDPVRYILDVESGTCRIKTGFPCTVDSDCMPSEKCLTKVGLVEKLCGVTSGSGTIFKYFDPITLTHFLFLLLLVHFINFAQI